MNLVELELDETLADFEVQDWIDNVFSVQYPDVKARIKKGCSGLCHKKDEWHYVKDGVLPNHSYRVLVYTDEGVGFGIYGLDDKKWHTYDTGFEVIAWKEIVPPEVK